MFLIGELERIMIVDRTNSGGRKGLTAQGGHTPGIELPTAGSVHRRPRQQCG